MDRSKAFGVDALLVAVVLAMAALALALSWRHWPDPIIDAGRDLYISEHLAHGGELYRDFVYYFPPLAPYLLAAVVRGTGASLIAFTWIGFAIALLTMAAMYVTSCVTSGRWAGATATALFAACSLVHPHPLNQNYLFPYSHSATLGMLFFIGVVAFFAVHLFHRRHPLFVAVALLCTLAAIWTKLEFAAFSLAIVAFVFIVHRIDWRWLIGFVLAFAASAAVVSWFFRDAPPDRFWMRGGHLSPPQIFASPAFKVFYGSISGLDQWPLRLLQSVFAAAVLVVVVLLFKNGQRIAAVAIASLLAMTIFFFAAWSVLQLALIPLAIRRLREPLALLLLASLCASSRIPLSLAPVWYGFVLLVPVYLLVAHVVFVALPRERVYSTQTARLWLIPFAVVVVHAFVLEAEFYSRPAAAIVTSRGILYTDRDRAAVMNRLGAALVRNHVTSLAVLPEGMTINYLFRIDTPLTIYSFNPLETSDPRVESGIIDEFEHMRPPWIVITNRDYREMGSRGFGIDHNRRLFAYINAKYRVADGFREPSCAMVLLARR